jgi:hypothetical protein
MPMTNKVMPIAKAISQRRICGSIKVVAFLAVRVPRLEHPTSRDGWWRVAIVIEQKIREGALSLSDFTHPPLSRELWLMIVVMPRDGAIQRSNQPRPVR